MQWLSRAYTQAAAPGSDWNTSTSHPKYVGEVTAQLTWGLWAPRVQFWHVKLTCGQLINRTFTLFRGGGYMLNDETTIRLSVRLLFYIFPSPAPASLTLTEHHIFAQKKKHQIYSRCILKNTFTWQLAGREPLLGHRFSSDLFLPFPLSSHPQPPVSPSLLFSHFHIAMAPLASHNHNNPPLPQLALIQATSPLPFLSLPHLSISARLGTAGVPLTTTLHWLLLMRNLPSSHLLDVHQRDTARDRQRACDWESFTDCILMECSY